MDADGLNAAAQLLAEGKPFPHPAGELVVTPHPGEMARLTGLSAAALAADREGIALRYAKAWDAVVVLKGARTVVASPDGRVCVNPTGNPGLARSTGCCRMISCRNWVHCLRKTKDKREKRQLHKTPCSCRFLLL